MKNLIITLVSIIFSFVMFSCTEKEPAPIKLSINELTLRNINDGTPVQSDTITILSGNGGYEIILQDIWEYTLMHYGNINFEDYIEVYLEGDKIVAKRTELIKDEDRIAATFHIVDAKGKKNYFVISSHWYTGGGLF